MTTIQDRIRGSLLGGAAGDALGYAVEFHSWDQICSRYGPSGIQDYDLERRTGTAVISDDTQMTLFTAEGILQWEAKRRLDPGKQTVPQAIYDSYLAWLMTQTGTKGSGSWLMQIPELNHPRAPGNTCLQALESGHMGTIQNPINHSKGCGGIMRVAPLGLYFNRQGLQADGVDTLGAEAAAITHGHPLGYLPAAAMVHIINRIVYGGCTYGNTLTDIVSESCAEIQRIFAGTPELDKLAALMDKAMVLSRNQTPDLQNLKALGEGWVAEETLAVALYCCLKYQGDFSQALTVSVNHDGDSDSTGAVTGNILGALWGEQAIPAQWKQDLELRDVILEVADDLYEATQLPQGSTAWSDGFYQKYVLCQRP